jgi:hypothetical protein
MVFPLITSLRWCHHCEACTGSVFLYRATHALVTTQTKTEGNDVIIFHTNSSVEAKCELSKPTDCCIYHMLSHPKILNFSHIITYVFRTIFSQQLLLPYFFPMALPAHSGSRPLFQFRNHFFTDFRTPWTSDQPVARPLPTHRTTQIRNKRIHIPSIHGLSWIRTHDRSARAIEDSSSLRQTAVVA